MQFVAKRAAYFALSYNGQYKSFLVLLVKVRFLVGRLLTHIHRFRLIGIDL